MTVDELMARIRAAIEEDEKWALACNLPYRYADDGSTAPASGVHWRWGVGENWDTAVPDPVADEFVGGYDGGGRATLVTVEEWPSTQRGEGWEHTSMMPRNYGAVEEMDSAAGGHIIRHDPNAVLTRAKWEHGLLATVAEFVNSDNPSVRVLARTAVSMLAKMRGIEPGNPWGAMEFER